MHCYYGSGGGRAAGGLVTNGNRTNKFICAMARKIKQDVKSRRGTIGTSSTVMRYMKRR